MSERNPLPRPTEAELAILRVLWQRGPCTVREVHEELNRDRDRSMGYTTVLKFMQIMHDKGLVMRDDAERAHIYTAVPTQESAQKRIVGDLVDRVFGGSAQKLVMHALTTKKASTEELAEIRRLLDELEGGQIMTSTGDLLHHPLAIALGWTLLHLLWQGALVGVVLAAVLPILRRSTANARYLACCAALATLAACPFVTFALLTGGSGGGSAVLIGVVTPSAPSHFPMVTPGLTEPSAMSAAAFRSGSVASAAQRCLPVLSAFWFIGVALMSLRLVCGWVGVLRLQRCETRRIAGELQAKCAAMAREMGIKRSVELLESALAEVPSTFGWLRTVVLLPASTLSGLSPRELEALLAHELAHIRRYDYLVNLLQTALETLLFYHPATWWISQQIRLEREHCCDDLAVAVLGDAKGYAKALAALETCRHEVPSPALGAAGGELLPRIRRVLNAQSQQAGPTPAGSAAMIVIALFLVSAIALALPAAYRRGAAVAYRADRSMRRTLEATIMDLLGTRRVTAPLVTHEHDRDWKTPSGTRPGAAALAANPGKASADSAQNSSADQTRKERTQVRTHTQENRIAIAAPQMISPAVHSNTVHHTVTQSVVFRRAPGQADPLLKMMPIASIASTVRKALQKVDGHLILAAQGTDNEDVNVADSEDAAATAASSNADDAADVDRSQENACEPDEARPVANVRAPRMTPPDMTHALKEADRAIAEAMRTADEEVRRALASVPVQFKQAHREVERAQQQLRQARQRRRLDVKLVRLSESP